jgi:Fe-S cluster assembly protein SufD
MTAVFADKKDLFLDHFTQLDNRWEGAPFARLRESGRKRFHELGLPGARTEDWRLTNIASLLKIPFELTFQEVLATLVPPPSRPDALRLVFVNGLFVPKWSTTANLPRGVQVMNLARGPAEAERHLDKIVDSWDQVFTALNTGMLRDGAFVSIADGQVVEQPIEVLYLTTPTDKPIAAYPRTLIVVGKNSQATIVESYQGQGTYFNNAVTEIAVADHAVVDHYKLQEESGDAYHLANTQVVLGGKSTFTSHYVSRGARLVRNEMRVRFDAEWSEATVNGLYLGSGQQHVDNFTVIDHAMPHCASHELYKGILNDQAQGVFNGKIFVRPDAQKTDAKQTNKVLLLSENATINTKPQLEIFADDVKCTHGATIGQLDDDQIFYLRARGLGLEEARKLLTFAFANDLLGRIKLEAIRDRLEHLMVRP